ncbi:serine/threonine-protein kinase PLK4-like [Puntigrus tetrazona]|uniref:serine/threonine-protein kinase PLK4-like n=1 Tax=Puntigrus tetrazona TaxID=1606681 RepID=UPI001C8ADF33|nr:serine/threonine-protein kinase PLK4-like [Puntigrus tetrazona]XP_043082629.1 serine/threonine-protein kinase PLK4-like [Puntigrus tetrazona]
MGNKLSALKEHGYSLVSEEENKVLVKNEGGEQFVIKKLNDNQEESMFLSRLDHPHIVQHKEFIRVSGCLYLVLEHCEGGDLAQKIQKKRTDIMTFSENEILGWIVKICMALKYLHDQQILHKHLKPKSIFFTTFGTIRLGEFGVVHQRSTEDQVAENTPSSYIAPEILNGQPYDEKTEVWMLGCVIYELCMLESAFPATFTVETVTKVLTSSYKALPETFSEDLRQLVTDILQTNPANRPSASEILTRPFIILYLREKNMQTIKSLYRTLEELRALADDLEKVHFKTTVGSLTGGVLGLAGGITSIAGLILSPFTLGASLIVTGVGIGAAVAGGVTAGASNITNMVNQKTNRQKIKTLIKEFQEKFSSTVCCIQNIQTAVETLQQWSTSDDSFSNASPGANAGARLGRGLGGIPEILRLIEVVNVGKVAAQAARAVRLAEAATGVLSALFVAVDVFFVFLDSREIHNIRQDYAQRENQRESESPSNQTAGSTDQGPNNSETTNLLPSDAQQAEELKSETMKFVTKIKDMTEELQKILDTLRDALQPN